MVLTDPASGGGALHNSGAGFSFSLGDVKLR